MRVSQLGRSTVEVTELGFGGGPLGGLFAPVDDDAAADALAARSSRWSRDGPGANQWNIAETDVVHGA